jgi:hypothetical protein
MYITSIITTLIKNQIKDIVSKKEKLPPNTTPIKIINVSITNE